MSQIFKSLSLVPRGIRHKLTVAFALMSIIPMLVFGYMLIHYIFPSVRTFWDVSLVFMITVFLILLGFFLAKSIIYPIIEITTHAKGIADGNLGEQLDIQGEDEIGELSGSLNRLSTKLKQNMAELHSYGEKIKEINMEINRKVFALSSLLQIGNLISTSVKLDEVFSLVTGKLAQLEADGISLLFLLDKDSRKLSVRSKANIEDAQVDQCEFKIGYGLLSKVVTTARTLIVDSQRKLKDKDDQLKNILQVKSIAALPVTSAGKVIGVLVIGNNKENFLFSDDEIELVGVFAKQVAVAIENDILMRKTEELTVKDELTGLFNESYIHGRLDEEIKRAVVYQRPCSFVIFDIDNFEQYRKASGQINADKSLRKIAQTLKESTSEIDKVSRFSDHQFAVIFPEKNKRQALHISENVKKEIERFALKENKIEPSVLLGVNAGISATPIDGITSVELINRALQYVQKAKSAGPNTITIS